MHGHSKFLTSIPENFYSLSCWVDETTIHPHPKAFRVKKKNWTRHFMWKIWKFSIQNIWDNIFFKNVIVKTEKIGVVSQWYQRDIKKLKSRKIKICKKLYMKSTKNDIFFIKIDKLLILKVGIFLFFALKGINKNCLTLNALGGEMHSIMQDCNVHNKE